MVSKSQTAFLTMNKSFTYRDQREIWCNVYHLDVVPPATADWSALFSAVWNLEKAFLPIDVQLEGTTGHEPGEPPVLVWEYDQPPVGEGGSAGSWVPAAQEYATPGDAASWVRWGTDLKNSRGKPVYLRNYFHGVYTTGDSDRIAPGQVTGLGALGAAFQTGITTNGRTYRRTGPNHGSPQNHKVADFITTRTLKRRGKRKKVTAQAIELAGVDGTNFFKWFLGSLPKL